MNFLRSAVTSKLKRTFGMSEGEKKAQTEKISTFPDWHAKCQKCGEDLTGTLSQIRAHQGDCRG